MGIPDIVRNDTLSVSLLYLVAKSEVKSDSGRLMGIPDIVGNDTFSVSLLFLVPKLGIFVQ